MCSRRWETNYRNSVIGHFSKAFRKHGSEDFKEGSGACHDIPPKVKNVASPCISQYKGGSTVPAGPLPVPEAAYSTSGISLRSLHQRTWKLPALSGARTRKEWAQAAVKAACLPRPEHLAAPVGWEVPVVGRDAVKPDQGDHNPGRWGSGARSRRLN